MLGKKSFTYKIFVISVICIFFFSTSCVAYRNMRPTGEYTVLNKEKLRDVYTFRTVHLPELEKPLLVVQLGNYPIFREHRKVRETGEIQKPVTLAACPVLAVGGFAMAKAASSIPAEGDQINVLQVTVATVGIIACVTGVIMLIPGGSGWRSVSRFSLQDTEVKSEMAFEPIANTRIKASSPTIAKEWILSTDSEGRVFLDMSQIAPLVRDRGGLAITFQTMNANKITNTFTIPQSFFADLKAYYASIRPPQLITTLSFDDVGSWKANRMIDGAEETNLFVTIENRGEGKALDVKLRMKCDNPNIKLDELISLGQISPGSKVEQRIPITAQMELADGLASFEIQATEQRGFDARPIQLQIPVRHLDKPALEITSQQINDRKSGLADGNGNGVPENNETLELTVFVKNSGVGDALGVNLNLASITNGVEKVQETFPVGNIEPQQTKEGKIVFRIPRTFNAAQIDYEITAEDKIGASRVSRKFSEALSRRVPILAYDYRILNAQGAPVERIHNGGSFVLEITPRNNGAIEANGVNLQLAAPTGITLANSSQIVGHLAQNAAATPIRFAFTVPRSFASPNAVFRIDLSQTDFSGKQDNLTVPLILKQPNLSETHQVVETNRNRVIEQGENVELGFQIFNSGDLSAENVRVTLDIANTGVDFRDREKLVGTILPSRGETVKFNFFVKFSTTPGPLPLSLKIAQADFPNVSKPITEYTIKEAGAQVVTITGEEQKRVGPPMTPRSVNAAPVIIVGAPRDGDTIYEDRVSLVGSVTDDRAINAIEIRLNGQIVSESERGITLTEKPRAVDPKQRAFDRVLALQPGVNTINVIVYDSDNAREERTITVTRMREESTIWAVVIGVANYPQVPPLEYTVKDAMAVRDYLIQNFGVSPDHLETLFNEQATTRQFRRVLGTDLPRKARKQDMVIIYYAGHGAPEQDAASRDTDGLEKYILPYDTDPNDLYGTGIRMTEIADIFQRLKAERVVFIVDACYSGASGGRTILSGRRANLSPVFLDRVAQGKGRVILAASDVNEVSVEGKNFGGGHGAFTFHLLEGLRGRADYDKNGEITVDEAFQYVSQAVPNDTGQKQHPMKKGEMVGQMILGRVK